MIIVKISSDGDMVYYPETETEEYALKCYCKMIDTKLSNTIKVEKASDKLKEMN